MADEKEKPSVVLSAAEIAYHAEQLYKREWDADRHAIRNPNAVFLGLLSYVRLAATRLAEAETRIAQQTAALEKRMAQFETRITTVERFKDEAIAQSNEMIKSMEEAERNGTLPAFIQPLAKPVETPAPNGDKNGGAA
jgi:hypothetical protein